MLAIYVPADIDSFKKLLADIKESDSQTLRTEEVLRYRTLCRSLRPIRLNIRRCLYLDEVFSSKEKARLEDGHLYPFMSSLDPTPEALTNTRTLVGNRLAFVQRGYDVIPPLISTANPWSLVNPRSYSDVRLAIEITNTLINCS